MLSQKQIKRKYMIRLFKTSSNLSPTSAVTVMNNVPTAILKVPSRVSLVTFNNNVTSEATHPRIEIQEKNTTDEAMKTDCSDTVSLASSKSWIAESVISSKYVSQKVETSKSLVKEKKVKFSNSVRVCLIPTRHEFAPISSQLWWETEEYAQFKKEAHQEMKEYCREYQCHPKEAMFFLYQPDDDVDALVNDYDESSIINELPLVSDNSHHHHHHHHQVSSSSSLSEQELLYSVFNTSSPVPKFKSTTQISVSPISSLKLNHNSYHHHQVHSHLSSMDETGINEGTVIALSEDHKPSVPAEQERIEKAGGFVFMDRVCGELAMSRAFGDFQYKENIDSDDEVDAIQIKNSDSNKSTSASSSTSPAATVSLLSAQQMVICIPDIAVQKRYIRPSNSSNNNSTTTNGNGKKRSSSIASNNSHNSKDSNNGNGHKKKRKNGHDDAMNVNHNNTTSSSSEKEKVLLVACDGVFDAMSNIDAVSFLHALVDDKELATANMTSNNEDEEEGEDNNNDDDDDDDDDDVNNKMNTNSNNKKSSKNATTNGDTTTEVITAEGMAECLIDVSLELGSTDNISAIVVKFLDNLKDCDDENDEEEGNKVINSRSSNSSVNHKKKKKRAEDGDDEEEE